MYISSHLDAAVVEAGHEVVPRPQLAALHEQRGEDPEALLHLCLEDHALGRARLSKARLARVNSRPASGVC